MLKQVLGDACSDIDKQFKILFANALKCADKQFPFLEDAPVKQLVRIILDQL